MDEQSWVALPPVTISERVAALPPGMHWSGILTGGRGAGKSTWCAALAEDARARGLSVAGLLSRAIFDNDNLPLAERVKVRIDLVDLASDAARVLATPGDPDAEGHGMRWHFHDDTITWGNQVLASVSGADLVIIDELGPLELTHGRGLTAGLALLDKCAYSCVAIVVVRPELLSQAQQRWPSAAVLTVPAWGRSGG